jgi:hypothetical protein
MIITGFRAYSRSIHPADTGRDPLETAAVIISRFFIMDREKGEMIADCDGELKLGDQTAKLLK